MLFEDTELESFNGKVLHIIYNNKAPPICADISVISVTTLKNGYLACQRAWAFTVTDKKQSPNLSPGGVTPPGSSFLPVAPGFLASQGSS